MTYYFIKNGENELGPFTTQQLKSKSIKRETLVWFVGIEEWTTAGQVHELKELFVKKLSSAFLVKNKVNKMLGNKLLRQQLKKVSYQFIFSRGKKDLF